MSPAILQYVLEVLQALPSLIKAGQDVVALIESTASSVTAMQAQNRDPSPAEWDAMHKTIAGLQSVLDGP